MAVPGYHWIVSYPKSGNTWIRLALLSLSRGGAAIDFSQHMAFAPQCCARSLVDAVLDIDTRDLSEMESANLRPIFHATEAASARAPLLRKVHDMWRCTPAGDLLFSPDVTLATIYLVRDPRDVAPSLAHHNGWSLDRAIAYMADRDADTGRRSGLPSPQLTQRLGTWNENVTSWLDAPDMPPPLVIRYEDMLAKPEAALSRAAAHLGWSFDRDALVRAVAATRFDVLQAEELRAGFPETPSRSRRFFRRGKAGGWREAMTSAQAARIVRDHGAVMQRLGYLP